MFKVLFCNLDIIVYSGLMPVFRLKHELFICTYMYMCKLQVPVQYDEEFRLLDDSKIFNFNKLTVHCLKIRQS